MRNLVFLVAVLICGCAQTPKLVEVVDIEKSNAVVVEDLRPAKESQGGKFMALHEFGTFRVADNVISPSALRIFQHRAFERLANEQMQLNLKVHHLVCYRNNRGDDARVLLGAGLGGPIGAIVGYALVDHRHFSSSSVVDSQTFEISQAGEYTRALYSKEENSNGAAVYIFYIETEINEKLAITRTLSSKPYIDALEDAIQFHLEQLTKGLP